MVSVISAPDGADDSLRASVFSRLRENGRASFSAIANEVGASRHAVANLVQRAIVAGELNVTASISPDLIGLERFAYLQLNLDGELEPVRQALVEMPETTFVASISGSHPLDAEVRVGADPHLRETIDFVKSLPGVRSVRTLIYDSIEINLYSPIRTGETGFALDELDRIIVRQLQRNGRAPLKHVAAAAGLSLSGARIRMERLLNSGAVRVVAIPVRGSSQASLTLGAGIQVRGPVAPALERVRQLEPEFLAVTMGEFDLLVTLSATSMDGLVEQSDRLRQMPEVESVYTWANLRIVKEQYGEDDRTYPTRRIPAADGQSGSRL